MKEFCHLHVHDEFSLLDGFGTAKDYLSRAKELGFNALALTNHGNIDGLIKFQKEADKQGITPILGCEAYIVPDLEDKSPGEKRGHICIWVKNQQGFENLCQMLTAANLDGFYYKPRIDYDLVLKHCEGLIFGTACTASFIHLEGGEDFLLELWNKTKEVYLEIMPHNFPEQHKHNELCGCLHDEEKIPLIATNDCHYILEEDAEAHDVLLKIQTKAKINDPKAFSFSTTGFHLRSYSEMVKAFSKFDCFSRKEIEEALHNTLEIVDKCKDFKIKRKNIFLPTVPGFEDMSLKKQGEHIWKTCFANLDNLSVDWDEETYHQYVNRLDEEFTLIEKKGFIPYFMVVYELVNWCKQNNIMIGPGRGSVGGSLMAYLLGITCIDPIQYDLLFSRFINEDRIDYPDIDIDFQDIYRDRIREHLQDLYGENNIASISTFLAMKGRMAIRDIARVFDIPNKTVDKFAKSIEEEGKETILNSIKNPEGQIFYHRYKKETDIAAKLEGQNRGAGQHAAGIIISADDLTKGTRGNLVVRNKQIVSNWDMPDSEYMGLMKLDVLGLNTLTILAEVKRLVAKNYQEDIIFENIPLNEKKVYAEISSGNNFGVFQLNTWSTSKLAKEIKCKNLHELSDIIALVRPGPYKSGMTDEYIRRKRGGKWVRKNKVYDDIVKDTYGVLIYQEQIMKVIYQVAGLPYNVADKIRKIIGKKRDAKEFEPFKKMFVEGCLKQETLNEKEAEEFWEVLQANAGYGFNACFAGDEIIDKGTKNKHDDLTIEEMFNIKNDKEYARGTNHLSLYKKYNREGYSSCLSMNDDFRLRLNKIKDIRYAGVQAIYEVITESGKSIKCTLQHKFPTPNGEKKLFELTEGHLLYVKDGYEKNSNKIPFYSQKDKNRNNFPTKGQRGFQKIPNGQSVLFHDLREVYKKQKEPCQICGYHFEENHKFELHHKNGDRTNNFKENLIWCCNSCHKKEHYKSLNRNKKFMKGLLTKTEPIKSIAFLRIDHTYDVEMEVPYHNLVLKSGIVASNSHSLAYAMLAYWTAWCKFHYPTEFICANLTYGSDKKKEEIVEEANRLGLKLVLPEKGISDPKEWIAKDKKLYIPLIEVKGIGEKTCEETAKIESKGKMRGFLPEEIVPKKTSKVDRILQAIKDLANKKDKDALNEYFNFKIY